MYYKNITKYNIQIKLMDPRPHNEFPRPRFNNPTLYSHSYHVVSPTTSTRVSTTFDLTARTLHPFPSQTTQETRLCRNIGRRESSLRKITSCRRMKPNTRQLPKLNMSGNRKWDSIRKIRGKKGTSSHPPVLRTACRTTATESWTKTKSTKGRRRLSTSSPTTRRITRTSTGSIPSTLSKTTCSKRTFIQLINDHHIDSSLYIHEYKVFCNLSSSYCWEEFVYLLALTISNGESLIDPCIILAFILSLNHLIEWMARSLGGFFLVDEELNASFQSRNIQLSALKPSNLKTWWTQSSSNSQDKFRVSWSCRKIRSNSSKQTTKASSHIILQNFREEILSRSSWCWQIERLQWGQWESSAKWCEQRWLSFYSFWRVWGQYFS